MKADILSLSAENAGSLELADDVFGLPARVDILHRVVTWQLAKRQAGTHKIKVKSEISRTSKKFGRQKGGGTARHGSRKSGIFKGGAKAFGPVVRSHAHDLPKKIRQLGLKTALSVKAAEGKLIVLDNLATEAKTKALLEKLGKLNISNALFIDGAEVDTNFKRAAASIPLVDVLPQIGANVYDILRRDHLVLTKAAVEALEARLK